MNRGDVIRYVDMTIEEGFSLQRGMNYMVNGKNYAIILMSVRKNAPYATMCRKRIALLACNQRRWTSN